MKNLTIKINENNCNQRIDIALSYASEHSRSMIQKLIYAEKITLDGQIILKANKITKIGEVYIINPIKYNIDIIPEKYNLEILYEDSNLIVINKPAELVVHPGAGNHQNTLMNKLAYHCNLSDIYGQERLGTVHRLDKGVSGCIIFAKDNITHINLSEQFARREIKKKYLALAHNTHSQIQQFIENFIERSKIHRQKMCVSNQGKLAQMNIIIKKVINYINKKISLIECFPITGRMHQIRVQLSNIGLPILNDAVYGKKETELIKNIFQNRIALHSSYIEFIHPKTKEIMKISSKLPEEFEKILSKKIDL